MKQQNNNLPKNDGYDGKLPETKTVYCIERKAFGVGGVDWFYDAKKRVTSQGDAQDIWFDLDVPASASKDEITDLADQAMWGKSYLGGSATCRLVDVNPPVFSRYSGTRPLDDTSIDDIPVSEQSAYWKSKGQAESEEYTDEEADQLYSDWWLTQQDYLLATRNQPQRTLSDLYQLWDKLGDVPVTDDGQHLDESFLHFGRGAEKESVWRWFEAANPRFVVSEVMQGIRQADEQTEKLPEIQFEQPVGHTVGGFTVGHLATMNRSKAVGTIVKVEEGTRGLELTLEFAEPQPVDAPEGVTSRRFQLDWRNISSTWAPTNTGKLRDLEGFLRTTKAGQGGEATFDRWVRATAADAEEYGHSEAVEYLRLGGDLRDKDLGVDGQWKLPEADVDVIDVATLDDEHAANFSKPYICQHEDGRTIEFDTEYAACAYQREHRIKNGMDPMTGQTVEGGKMPELVFSVKFRYFDSGLLAEHLEKIGSGDASLIEDRLKVALLNPTTRPENAGYRIVEARVSHINGSTYSLMVRVQVTDAEKLADEAGEEYRRCWGEPDHEFSVGEQLYEVLVASNASPAPMDIGIEVITWRNESRAAQAEADAGLKLPDAERDLDEDEIRDFLTDRIESGDMQLEDITKLMVRYGLMDPKAFQVEMCERMQNHRNEQQDRSPAPGM